MRRYTAEFALPEYTKSELSLSEIGTRIAELEWDKILTKSVWANSFWPGIRLHHASGYACLSLWVEDQYALFAKGEHNLPKNLRENWVSIEFMEHESSAKYAFLRSTLIPREYGMSSVSEFVCLSEAFLTEDLYVFAGLLFERKTQIRFAKQWT